jgi:hypothetical protein
MERPWQKQKQFALQGSKIMPAGLSTLSLPRKAVEPMDTTDSLGGGWPAACMVTL